MLNESKVNGFFKKQTPKKSASVHYGKFWKNFKAGWPIPACFLYFLKKKKKKMPSGSDLPLISTTEKTASLGTRKETDARPESQFTKRAQFHQMFQDILKAFRKSASFRVFRVPLSVYVRAF